MNDTENEPNILHPNGTVDLAAVAKASYQTLGSSAAFRPRNYLYWVVVGLLAGAVLFK